jgi:DNA (cytosine-5)-methyltransferase 1
MNQLKEQSASAISDVRRILARRPIVIELFTGVGGLALGLEQAGFFTALAVELEEISGRYAQYNFPATKVLYGQDKGDVRKFGKDILSTITELRGKEVTLIAGGPPCQGFSLAGKKTSDDPLNDLVLQFARVVLEVRPLCFLMENVPGITSGTSPHLAEALKRLSKGYRLSEPTIHWACDFGAPQARARVLVLGLRRDLGIDPSLPFPSHIRPERAQQTLVGMQATPTVWEAISDLPKVDDYPNLIDEDRVPYDKEPETSYQLIMRGKQSDTDDLSPPVIWDSSICTNVRRTQHGPDLLNRFRQLKFGKMDRLSGIRRLEPYDVSTTIRAGTTRERGSWSAPRPLHPYQDRVITTRECARLQSFPDWFFFHPVKWHGNRQVGNAVPPLLARAIGKHILRLLKIKRQTAEIPSVLRDESLVRGDIEDVAASGLSKRRISQKVTHPRKKKAEATVSSKASGL